MKLSAREKKFFVFCALAIALPLGVGVYVNRLNAASSAQIPPYPRAPKPNGYDLYVAVATAMTRATPNVDPNSDAKPPTDAKARAARYSLARRNAWLGQNGKAFALFNQAMKTPSLAPPSRSPANLNPTYAQLRELARAKAAQSNTLWMRGDFNGALQSGLDTIQMGHDMRRGTQIIGSLVGMAIGAIGRQATNDTIDHLDAIQAKSAARRLEKLLQTRWNLDQSLTEEKYANQSFLLPLVKTGTWRLSSAPWMLSGKAPSLADRLHLATLPTSQILADIDNEYNRQIANAKLPYANAGQPRPNINDPFVPQEFTRLLINNARDLVGDRLLMLRLALRAYRLEKGVYPPNLNALVPAYLSAVPADPFGGGEAMRYKISGKTYVLWSIGPDGKDDGAVPIPFSKPVPKVYAGDRPRIFIFKDFNGKGDVVAGVNG